MRVQAALFNILGLWISKTEQSSVTVVGRMNKYILSVYEKLVNIIRAETDQAHDFNRLDQCT